MLAACSDDIATVPPQPTVGEVDSESVVVPVSITFGGTYALPANTTRSAPPGAATDPYDPKVDGEAAAVQTDHVRTLPSDARWQVTTKQAARPLTRLQPLATVSSFMTLPMTKR